MAGRTRTAWAPQAGEGRARVDAHGQGRGEEAPLLAAGRRLHGRAARHTRWAWPACRGGAPHRAPAGALAEGSAEALLPPSPGNCWRWGPPRTTPSAPSAQCRRLLGSGKEPAGTRRGGWVGGGSVLGETTAVPAAVKPTVGGGGGQPAAPPLGRNGLLPSPGTFTYFLLCCSLCAGRGSSRACAPMGKKNEKMKEQMLTLTSASVSPITVTALRRGATPLHAGCLPFPTAVRPPGSPGRRHPQLAQLHGGGPGGVAAAHVRAAPRRHERTRVGRPRVLGGGGGGADPSRRGAGCAPGPPQTAAWHPRRAGGLDGGAAAAARRRGGASAGGRRHERRCANLAVPPRA